MLHHFGFYDLLFIIIIYVLFIIKVGKLSKTIMKIKKKQSCEISSALKYNCILYDHLKHIKESRFDGRMNILIDGRTLYSSYAYKYILILLVNFHIS